MLSFSFLRDIWYPPLSSFLEVSRVPWTTSLKARLSLSHFCVESFFLSESERKAFLNDWLARCPLDTLVQTPCSHWLMCSLFHEHIHFLFSNSHNLFIPWCIYTSIITVSQSLSRWKDKKLIPTWKQGKHILKKRSEHSYLPIYIYNNIHTSKHILFLLGFLLLSLITNLKHLWNLNQGSLGWQNKSIELSRISY